MNEKKSSSLLIILSASAAAIILLSVYLYVSTTAITASPPVYEEMHPSINGSHDVINITHYKIHKPPPRSGIQEEGLRPKVAIIIDDLGYNSDLDFSFLNLNLELSLSILPSAPFTDVIVREANKKGREILLHQPMEPKFYPSVDPGPGTLLLSMNERDLRQVLDKNLKEITGAKGMNNHMGSSFTENREKMLVILQALKDRGLFYVDSRTTKGALGFEQAKKIGLSAAQRTVFLDNNPDPKAICAQIERLLEIAESFGSAIGIGHPYNETYEIIDKYQKCCFVIPLRPLINTIDFANEKYHRIIQCTSD
jgi:polysaccharide deacetylase 2 family uncharacterized protein YibQ